MKRTEQPVPLHREVLNLANIVGVRRKSFERAFVPFVMSLSIEEVGVRLKRPILRPERYSFRPLIGRLQKASMMPAETQYDIAENEPPVEIVYRDSQIWLDSQSAIGLVCDGALTAIAAGGITNRNVLAINQIQSVGPAKAHPRYTHMGIFEQDGLDWRQTLVRSWEQFGAYIGYDAITLYSAENTEWRGMARPRNYEEVAQQRGYELDDVTKNWTRTLIESESPS